MKKFAKTITQSQILLLIGVALLALSYFLTDLGTVYERSLQVVGIVLIIAGGMFASARFNNKNN